jgi:hypothetical protein
MPTPTGIGRERLKWDKPRGPKWLQEIIQRVLTEISARQPLDGIGIHLNETEGGREINYVGGTAKGGISSSNDPDISFFLSDATTNEGTPPVTSNKVFIADGKINGAFPDGMGSSEYILDLADPSDSLIYAGATFNPTDLSITDRFLGVSGSGDFPESRVEGETSGFLYWMLGFTFFDSDDTFRVVNTRVGDINFEFSYGALNGLPALLIVDSAPGWLDLTFA